jgi:hypothetical protein
MNFVDNFDRLKGDYQMDGKSKKWWLRFLFHFIDCSVTNAFIMHKESEIQQLSNKDFRHHVYKGLLAPRIVKVNRPVKSDPRRSSVVAIKRGKPHVDRAIYLEGSSHQPQHLQSPRICAVFSTEKTPVHTRWMCTICDVPLCLRNGKPCFQDFYT